jgi:predicted outer membrane protein
MQMRTTHARRILITLAACVALLAIPALASANKNLRTGFLDNAYASSDPAAFWADAVALNVGFMRFDLQWAHMAASKPKNPRNVEDPFVGEVKVAGCGQKGSLCAKNTDCCK